MKIYLWVAVMTFLGALGAMFLKKSTKDASQFLSIFRSSALYLGVALYAASAVLNVILLRYLEYSVLYPMTAVTYIWSLLLSRWQLNEPITGRKMTGVALICLGVLALAQ